MSATAQDSTSTDFNHRLDATYVIVAMEYQVCQGFRLILNTELIFFICILINRLLIHGYCNERKGAIYLFKETHQAWCNEAKLI